MAQATSYQSPDFVEQQDDSTLNTSGQPSGEKKSVFGKLKEKTKHKTSKLKSKLKPGSGGDATAAGDTSSSSSSEDESDVPPNNAFSGMTQPEYERKLNTGELTPNRDADNFNPNVGSPGAVSVDEFNQKTPSDFPPSHQADDSSLSKQFEGLSTEDKPSSHTDTSYDTPLGAGVGSTFDKDSATTGDSILKKAGDPTADDTDVGKDKPDPEGLLSGERSADSSKTWGQWVGEKVGLAKPSSPTTATSTTGDKPITQKIQETVLGAKDAVVGKTSATADAAKGTVEENKQAATTTDPQKQTYTQKLTGAIYTAKDSLMSSTHPGDEDKALSQKVTETVSNLPTTIKSTLGFGANKSPAPAGATSATTTPGLDTSVPSDTEESPSAPPQSPGLVSRITGSVTSLFGKKQPSDSLTAGQVEDTTPTSGLPTSGTATTESDTRPL